MPGMVNMRWDTGTNYQAPQTSEISEGVPAAGRAFLRMRASWFSCNQPHQVHFADSMKWEFTSTPCKLPEGKENTTFAHL